MRFTHVATPHQGPGRGDRLLQGAGAGAQPHPRAREERSDAAFMTRPGDDFSIELVYNWAKDEPYDGGARFGHFAFDVEDLDAAYTELVAAGATDVAGREGP